MSQGLYLVIVSADLGYSPGMLHDQFPTLEVPLLERVLAFRERPRDEVDAYVEADQAEIDRQRVAAPPGPIWAELRRKMAERERVK